MPVCPVCDADIDADDAAFAHHVNSHFEEQLPDNGTASRDGERVEGGGASHRPSAEINDHE